MFIHYHYFFNCTAGFTSMYRIWVLFVEIPTLPPTAPGNNNIKNGYYINYHHYINNWMQRHLLSCSINNFIIYSYSFCNDTFLFRTHIALICQSTSCMQICILFCILIILLLIYSIKIYTYKIWFGMLQIQMKLGSGLRVN